MIWSSDNLYDEKGKQLIKSMKRRISKLLLPKIKTQVAYTAKKLSACFKDQSKFEYQHDVVYYADWPNEKCRED